MNNKLLILIFAGMAFFSTSCDQDETPIVTQPSDLDFESRRLIEAKSQLNNIINQASPARSFGDASINGRGINNSESRLSPRFSRNNINRKALLLDTRLHQDSTDIDSLDWGTCAKISIDINSNSITTILDYGDGCYEFGAFVKGKIKFTDSWRENGGSYKVEFDKYFEDYTYAYDSLDSLDSLYTDCFFQPLEINGYHFGSFALNPGEEFEFAEEYSGDMTFSYQTGQEESYTFSGSSSSTENQYLVTKNDFSGSNSDGDVFSGKVLSPLVFDYTCDPWVYTYTQGVEEYIYNENTFGIDYGDGACDEIITLTEGGNTLSVDLGSE